MTFSTDTNGSKEFYDEFHGTTTMYKSLFKKPNTKVVPLTKRITKNAVSMSILLVLFIVLYFLSFDKFALFVVAFLAAVEVLMLSLLIITNKLIRQEMARAVPSEVTIDNTGIQFKNDNGVFKMNWEKTKFILINKYSIVFAPMDKNAISLALDTDCKDLVLEGLKEVGKEGLVVYNTDLYK